MALCGLASSEARKTKVAFQKIRTYILSKKKIKNKKNNDVKPVSIKEVNNTKQLEHHSQSTKQNNWPPEHTGAYTV